MAASHNKKDKAMNNRADPYSIRSPSPTVQEAIKTKTEEEVTNLTFDLKTKLLPVVLETTMREIEKVDQVQHIKVMVLKKTLRKKEILEIKRMMI